VYLFLDSLKTLWSFEGTALVTLNKFVEHLGPEGAARRLSNTKMVKEEDVFNHWNRAITLSSKKDASAEKNWLIDFGMKDFASKEDLEKAGMPFMAQQFIRFWTVGTEPKMFSETPLPGTMGSSRKMAEMLTIMDITAVLLAIATLALLIYAAVSGGLFAGGLFPHEFGTNSTNSTRS